MEGGRRGAEEAATEKPPRVKYGPILYSAVGEGVLGNWNPGITGLLASTRGRKRMGETAERIHTPARRDRRGKREKRTQAERTSEIEARLRFRSRSNLYRHPLSPRMSTCRDREMRARRFASERIPSRERVFPLRSREENLTLLRRDFLQTHPAAILVYRRRSFLRLPFS